MNIITNIYASLIVLKNMYMTTKIINSKNKMQSVKNAKYKMRMTNAKIVRNVKCKMKNLTMP